MQQTWSLSPPNSYTNPEQTQALLLHYVGWLDAFHSPLESTRLSPTSCEDTSLSDSVSSPHPHPFYSLLQTPTHRRERARTRSWQPCCTPLGVKVPHSHHAWIHCRFCSHQPELPEEGLLPVVHPLCLFNNFLGTDNCVCEVI